MNPHTPFPPAHHSSGTTPPAAQDVGAVGRISRTGIAYFRRADDPLADKLVRLLDLHNDARDSALLATRLPGLRLAIETVRARIMARRMERLAA